MDEAPVLERLLKRDRAITIAGLALLCLVAWLFLLSGAGLGMSAWEMTRLTLLPHLQSAAAMPGMSGHDAPAWPLATLLAMVAMWWLMMVAMMAPSAAPTILLYARVYRHAAARDGPDTKVAPTGAFAAGYIMIWLLFSVAATGLHRGLQQGGLIAAETMGSQSRWLSAGLLAATGLYQLSPLKQACLTQCRNPGDFLSRHWRPGQLGAVRLGVIHGAFCVGCCWLLMGLLFVGGVMNLAWIALLTLLVLLEKLVPAGRRVGQITGILLIGWGVATLIA